MRTARVAWGSGLADVVSELAQRDALDVLELGEGVRDVRGRPGLREEQAVVAFVFRVARRAVAGRAADAAQPGSLNKECLAGVELARLDLAEFVVVVLVLVLVFVVLVLDARRVEHPGSRRDGG